MNPRPWTPTDDITLEPNALRAAVELDRNVAVAAGPGSGKTELLAQRANFLLTTGTCPDPRRIVAISFKIDAASNLRDRVTQRCGPRAARRFDSFTFHAFARQLIIRHRPHLAYRVPSDFRVGPGKSRTQLHYNELLSLAHEVLDKDQRAIHILRQAYAFAFFDEFQDCTDEQYTLLKRLFANTGVRTTAVGDSKQRIMGWAHALEDAMSDYVADFEAIERPVYLNHRSLLRLRRMQNAIVRVMDPAAAVPDADLLSAVGGRDGEVHVLRFATAREEAVVLADAIATDIATGTPPAEIAVLAVRNPAEHCENLIPLLAARGVAIRDEKDAQDAFAEPVGQLLLDAARLIVLGHAPEEYLRLCQFMTRNCVHEQQAARRRRRLDEFIQQTRDADTRGSLRFNDPEAFGEILFAFLRLCERQFLSRLSVEYADNAELTFAARKTVQAVQSAIAGTDSAVEAMARLSRLDAVRLMTVHKSKGLEFDCVYFVAIENEAFFGEIKDERSAFFVGISRARSKLSLTVSRHRPLPSHPPYRWSVERSEQSEFLAYGTRN
jgi:superfamily I DNA/RNA helicase